MINLISRIIFESLDTTEDADEKTRNKRTEKRQTMNDLWLAQKPIVTMEDNPDRDDSDLLVHPSSQQNKVF